MSHLSAAVLVVVMHACLGRLMLMRFLAQHALSEPLGAYPCRTLTSAEWKDLCIQVLKSLEAILRQDESYKEVWGCLQWAYAGDVVCVCVSRAERGRGERNRHSD